MDSPQPNNFLMRISDGKNFKASSIDHTWGIDSRTSAGKGFLADVKPGDKLWFIKSGSNGQILAVATYCSHTKRQIGELINLSLTNAELGWDDNHNSDTEIHYTDLYNVSDCNLLTHIKGAVTIRKYNEKCQVNLPIEYANICRYRKVTNEF